MLITLLSMLDSESDRREFAMLYERYHEEMELAALRILPEQKDAEDAMQNAFIQVIRHFGKVSEIPCEELPFWLICIVKNEALMILRKNSRIVPLEDWDAFAQTTAEISNYRELVVIFRRLPETYRAVMEMKLLLEYSDAEIGKHLGLSETAVSTRVSRGRQMLRKIAEKEGFRYDR